MPKPVLHIFAISHFCEKARWALDYLGFDYEVQCVAPGIHLKLAQDLGVAATSVPILNVGGQAIQGSTEIIDWADKTLATDANRLTPENARAESIALEKRLDDGIGVHARRYYYSEALVDCPETVKPIFTKDIPPPHQRLINAGWENITALMISSMDLGPAQRLESKIILEDEISWLDDLLSDGKQFISGDRFSRLDITAASLLAPLAMPTEHPTYADLSLPPQLAAETAGWQDRPSINWVREIYRQYR